MTKKIEEGWMSFQELIGKYEVRGIGEPITNIRIINEMDMEPLKIEFKSVEIDYWHKIQKNPVKIKDIVLIPNLYFNELEPWARLEDGSIQSLKPQVDRVIIEGVIETEQSFRNRLTYIKTIGA